MHIAHRVAAGFAAAVLAAGVGTVVLGTAAGAEDPDVGELVATAGNAYGQTSITGALSPANDVDLYKICISSGPAFGVTVTGLGAGNNDGQLYLFDAAGFGKAFNDDQPSANLVPAITAGNAVTSALPAGEYLLGVSNFSRAPATDGDPGQFIFPASAGNGAVVGPLVTNLPLAGWANDATSNAMTTYTLNLTGVACAGPALAGVPGDITLAATSAAGATVNFTVPTATDFLDQPLAVVCVPGSGGIFPIGTTPVTCTAIDSLQQSASATFNVTVTNATPTITVPDDITVNATSAAGAVVDFDASGSDLEQGALSPDCTPPSGSTFVIGTTTVTCVVTDFGGLQARDTFDVTVLDNPPTITVPADITATATSNSGAPVGFTSTGSDIEDGTLTPVCAPAAGSTFPIGTTEVTCTVTDSAKQAVSDTFNVTVVNTPPNVAVPANLNVTATSADGAAVTFAATATDRQEGTLTPVCSPASGSTFAIGATTVSCTATDALGLSSTATFTVTVAAQPTADLQISKTSDVTRASPGDRVVFTITVRNNGPSAADRVVVTDTLPPGLGLSATSASGDGFVCTVTGAVARCGRSTLANGASAVVTVTATVGTNVSGGQELTNRASVSAATLDPTSANDSAAATVQVASLPPTGGSPLPMVMVGLLTLLAGIVLVGLGWRKRTV